MELMALGISGDDALQHVGEIGERLDTIELDTRFASARQLRPQIARQGSPLAAFQQCRQLPGRERYGSRRRHRPDELSPFQTLDEQAHPDAVVPKNLDQPASASAEGIHRPRKWI